jgi:hypothetical protein
VEERAESFKGSEVIKEVEQQRKKKKEKLQG